MEQLRLTAGDLSHLAPELTLVVTAIVLTIIDLLLPKQLSRNLLGWLSLIGIVISGLFVIDAISQINSADPNQAQAIVLLNQSYRIDDFGNLFKLLFLGTTGLIILMSIGSVKESSVPHLGEYYYLYLPATIGAMIMASSGDLITLYVGLEVLSITSYILVGMRKNDLKSNEAAFKYLVLGGVSSAFILYGMSFLYGLTGTTNIGLMNGAIMANIDSVRALVYLSFFLLLAGFGFKIAAAPFHNWSPDVYQGAPTPVTAYLAVVSKAAGFAILLRVMYSIFYGMSDSFAPQVDSDLFLAMAVLAAAAMILGNTQALKQRNMKRLLALSGVANAGYLLVPVATKFSYFHFSNFAELYFYMVAYSFMTVGAFAVVMAVSRSAGHEEMSGFAGLYYRAPWTTAAMTILMVSLAGLPVTGGFFGKLYIMLGAVQMQYYWLAVIMIVTSAISFYYYFNIGRQMFMRQSESGQEMRIPFPLGLTIWICTIATLLLGFFPQKVIAYIESIFGLVSDFVIRVSAQ